MATGAEAIDYSGMSDAVAGYVRGVAETKELTPQMRTAIMDETIAATKAAATAKGSDKTYELDLDKDESEALGEKVWEKHIEYGVVPHLDESTLGGTGGVDGLKEAKFKWGASILDEQGKAVFGYDKTVVVNAYLDAPNAVDLGQNLAAGAERSVTGWAGGAYRKDAFNDNRDDLIAAMNELNDLEGGNNLRGVDPKDMKDQRIETLVRDLADQLVAKHVK